MRFKPSQAVLFFALIAACGDDGDDDVDVGRDASASSAEDGGLDGGQGQLDAGHDAQSQSADGAAGSLDGGASDASSADGSSANDGSTSVDAGSGADAATPDAGSQDAGATATFSAVYGLFAERCTGCHRPREAGPAGGLDLSSKAVAYAELVTNPAAESCGDRQRVTPNQPDLSFLVEKLEPDPSCGQRMPRNQPPLSNEQIALVRAWVAAGAPNN